MKYQTAYINITDYRKCTIIIINYCNIYIKNKDKIIENVCILWFKKINKFKKY